MTVNAILEPSRATRRHARSTPSLSGVQQRTSEWFNASNDASLNGKRCTVRRDGLASLRQAVRRGAFARNAKGRREEGPPSPRRSR